jgi:hypothetical protein
LEPLGARSAGTLHSLLVFSLDAGVKIFSFRTQIGMPFGYFKNLGTLHGKLFEHKAWELEHTYYGGSLLDIDITLSTKEDHSGFEFVFGVFGYGINFRIYDTRHWNFILERWESYEYDETLLRAVAKD